jgi:NADPH2:quinone reductase
MKAVLSKTVGGPDTLVLEEVADPAVKPGEVVISVKACGVNYPDVIIIEDKYQFKPDRPFSPGGEISGVVESVGEGVTKVKVGDRVIGQAGWGGMAEKIALAESRCIPMPESMSFAERAALQAGETLLVLGAAGGVGLAAVELGKAAGARVVAACSSQEKVDLCIKHGADDGVVYSRGPFDKDGKKALADQFKAVCGKDGANVIYDAVGGDYAEAALRAIAWEGRFLVIGFPSGIPSIPLNLTLLKGCQIVGVFWGAFTAKTPDANQENIRELMALYAGGKIKPHVSAAYPLAQAGRAITDLAERRAQGKVVVTID